MDNITALSGHTSADTAYLVTDYPFGFRLRCKIRYWVETKAGHGQRVVSQTTNPRRSGEVWNKPKASTYSNLRVLYLTNDNGHVHNAGLTYYATSVAIDGFVQDFAAALTSDYAVKQLVVLRAIAARSERAARRAARLADGAQAVSKTVV